MRNYTIPKQARLKGALKDAIEVLKPFGGTKMSKNAFKEALRPILERWGITLGELAHTLEDKGYIRLRQKSVAILNMDPMAEIRGAFHAIAIASQCSPFTWDDLEYWAKGRTSKDVLQQVVRELVRIGWLIEKGGKLYATVSPRKIADGANSKGKNFEVNACSKEGVLAYA